MTPYEQFVSLTFKWHVTTFKCIGVNYFNDTLCQKFIRYTFLGMICIYVLCTGYTVYNYDLDVKLQCISVIGFSFQACDIQTSHAIFKYFQN